MTGADLQIHDVDSILAKVRGGPVELRLRLATEVLETISTARCDVSTLKRPLRELVGVLQPEDLACDQECAEILAQKRLGKFDV